MTSKMNVVLKASFWVIIFSWYSRILSLLTVVVLARSLSKEDFGILAGCFVIKNFFNAISSTGVSEYVIRKNKITADDINTAWTIHFFSRNAMALLIFSTSEYAATFMGIPELGLILKVVSLSAVFQSVYNLGELVESKRLNYSKISSLQAIARTISSTVSICLAIYYESYWAVVIAEVLFYFIHTLLTHIAYDHKLRFVTTNIGLQWGFSKWVILKGIVGYIKTAFDKIVVSKNNSVADLGVYNFSMEIASTVSNLLITPVSKLIYPSLSSYVDDKAMLVDKVYKSLLILSTLYLPVVFGGVFLSDVIVPTVFGAKWEDAVPLFNLFLPMTFAGMFIRVLTSVFTLTGKVKRQFVYELITSLCFLLVIVNLSNMSLLDFAFYRHLIPFVMLTALIFVLQRIIPISLTKLIAILSLPLISSVTMLLSLSYLNIFVEKNKPISYLILNISEGAVVYLICTIILLNVTKKFVPEYDFLYKSFISPISNYIKSKRSLI